LGDISAIKIDDTDKEFMRLITKDHSSAYAVWSAYKKEHGTKAMGYKNVNKRITKLLKAGFLEEIKPDSYTVNIHGRKDYKLTVDGMEQVILNILMYPKEIQNIVRYMNQIGLDKQLLEARLQEGYRLMVEAVDEYQKITNTLLPSLYDENIERIADANRMLSAKSTKTKKKKKI
jgi:hypothetical protein